MPLTPITAGDDVSATPLNNNFNYLAEQIAITDTKITNATASMSSALSTAVSTLNSDITNSFKNLPASSYIDGLVVTRVDNTTIKVTKGSCYNSTNSVVLKLTSDTTKQNLSQSANTTYYVYLVGNADGSSVEVIISTESETPSVAEGKVYRRINYYTTNSSGYINKTQSEIDADKLTATQSYNTDSYCRLSNGLLIQWGYHSTTSNMTVTFPTAYSWVMSIVATPTSGENCIAIHIKDVNATYFKGSSGGHGGSHWDTNVKFFWVAIGL